jgi:hypothetical protein
MVGRPGDKRGRPQMKTRLQAAALAACSSFIGSCCARYSIVEY